MKKGDVLFDDWSEVKDCNQCEPYWNNQCDGAKVGSEKRCTAFKATRRVDIPLEIKELRKALNWHSVAIILIAIRFILQTLDHIVGG